MNTLFNLDKAIQSVLYVSNRLQRRDFHKIFKVVYFADRNHLSDYGRMITGDTYIAMNDGPVPSNMYDIFKGLRGDGFFYEEAMIFSKYFEIVNWNFVNPKMDADLSLLSESDIEYLNDSIHKYGDLTWDEVREKSHDYAWRNTVKDRPISIKDLLLEKGDSDEYIEFVDNMNEIKRLIDSL